MKPRNCTRKRPAQPPRTDLCLRYKPPTEQLEPHEGLLRTDFGIVFGGKTIKAGSLLLLLRLSGGLQERIRSYSANCVHTCSSEKQPPGQWHVLSGVPRQAEDAASITVPCKASVLLMTK